MCKIGHMASNFALTLQRLSEKSRFLTERFKVVLQQRDDALAKIEMLQKQLEQCRKQLETLRTENEYLKVSSVLAPTSETVEATRVVIKKLIAEIDRCMVELNT